MKFTFDAYRRLIDMVISKGYTFSKYSNYTNYQKPCILRHDVDFDLQVAEQFAAVEKNMGGGNVSSTYFVLISSNFYNIYSKENYVSLCNIRSMGHEVGLHFDEQKYKHELEQYTDDEDKIEFVKNAIIKETVFLSEMSGCKIHTVSMHRPSKLILSTDLKIPGIINSYCGEFFKEFKYISDSRMNWREDVEKIVQLENDRALHLLTHPIWYSNEERSMKRCLEDLIKNKTFRTYESLYDNFRDLDDVITKGEILCRLQNF